MNRPSREKNVLAPPHFVSTSIPSPQARYDPDCTNTVWPASCRCTTSPGSAGPTVISPGPACAVYVLMKKLSPPSAARLMPPRSPPSTLVCIPTFEDIAIMAPASARTASSASSPMLAIANAGPCSMPTFIRASPRCRRESRGGVHAAAAHGAGSTREAGRDPRWCVVSAGRAAAA